MKALMLDRTQLSPRRWVTSVSDTGFINACSKQRPSASIRSLKKRAVGVDGAGPDIGGGHTELAGCQLGDLCPDLLNERLCADLFWRHDGVAVLVELGHVGLQAEGPYWREGVRRLVERGIGGEAQAGGGQGGSSVVLFRRSGADGRT